MISCPSNENLAGYVAGSSAGEIAAQVEQHLNACAICASRLEEMRSGRAALDRIRKGLHLCEQSAGHEKDVPPADAQQFPVISGYVIERELGSGGMGVVYQAVQIALGREVALKVLPSHLAILKPDSIERFRREASAASKLHHPNIIPIFDFASEGAVYYYSMELIEGESVDRLIQGLQSDPKAIDSPKSFANFMARQPLDLSRCVDPKPGTGSSGFRGQFYFRLVANWIASIADALEYAHLHGVIHRDVKPSNLMLSRDGTMLLGDFGLAKVAGEQSVTITGSLQGTIRYLSPEQAMAKRVLVDHRTDIYSLGVTMYELLCFSHVFPGSNEKQVLQAIIATDPVGPRKLFEMVPRELETICLKALEKHPDHRFPTARAFAEDLRRYIQDKPIEARRPGLIRRLQKFLRRHKVASFSAILGVLLIGAIATSIHENRLRKNEARAKNLAAIARSIGLGNNSMERKNWAEAQRSYDEALQIDPGNPKVLGNLAILRKSQYNELGDVGLLQEAIAYSDKAILREPTRPDLWNTKGVCLKILGRYKEAVTCYEKAIELEPNKPSSWINLGISHALQFDFENAQKAFREAINTKPEDPSETCDSWRQLAALQFALRDTGCFSSAEKANACITKQNKPIDADALLLMARIALDREMLGIARNNLYAASAAGSIVLKEKLERIGALISLRSGDSERAIEQAQAALKLGDVKTVDYLLIAVAMARRSDKASAQQAFDDAIKSWPPQLMDRPLWPTANKGILWFERTEELDQLRREAEKAIAELN